METGIGHNSGVLKKAAEKAQMGLAMVHKGEEDVIEGWLEYGEALNEGRELFPKGDNERFSVWLATNNLSVANDAERAAAMWAAANPDEFHQTKEDNPRVRTVRGLHSKWKEAQEKKAKDDESGTEQDGDTDDDVVDTGDNSTNTPDTSEGDVGSSNSQDNSTNSGSNGNSDKKDQKFNTQNPDTSKAKADIGLIASSFIGVKTNVDLYLATNNLECVDDSELANAILQEVIQNSASVMTDDEISDYIESLRDVLNMLSKSLPILEGPKSNVVNFTNLKETYQ